MFLSSGGGSNAASSNNSGGASVNNSKTILQAHLGNNLSAVSFVAGNANVVNDTLRTGNWNFYVAGGNSISAITLSSNQSEWTSGNLLSGVGETFSGTLVRATFAADANSRITDKPYLQLANPSGTLGENWQFAKFTPFAVPATGFSYAFWFWIDTNGISRNDYIIFVSNLAGDNQIGLLLLSDNTFEYQNNNPTAGNSLSNFTSYVMPINTWVHIGFTVDPNGSVKLYINGVLKETKTNTYPLIIGLQTYYDIGVTNDGGFAYGLRRTSRIDNFKVFTRLLSDAEVLTEKNRISSGVSILNDLTTGTTWKTIPGTLVDESETSYTVKNNEIALLPGTNSTYAVWTATKSTNLKIDVSFADYHSRSTAGVGFQMFKIKSDNTFDSVIFPRTVTSTALTDANPTNYLTVPTINTSVNAGDKIYYRVDANGNTTAASSVLATTIFTDAVSVAANPVENKLLQANLGNNLALTSFVAGNANVVLDTLGTGNWNFYVAPSTSIASITSASASSEWNSGSLLSGIEPSPGTLINGAQFIAESGNTRIPGKPYLQLINFTAQNVNTVQHARFPSFSITSSGFSYACWLWTDTNNLTSPARGQDCFIDLRTNVSGLIVSLSVIPPNQFQWGGSGITTLTFPNNPIPINTWIHVGFTVDSTNKVNLYINGNITSYANVTATYPTLGTYDFYNIGTYSNNASGGGYSMTGTTRVDNFKVFTKMISASEMLAEFNRTSNISLLTQSTAITTPAWAPTPGTPVDSSETNYTVKSNEVALIPGANSTYAVWTSPKTTNIKIDVSFADYNSRSSAGVGFQMFKINQDNTFGSVIFPRTVTSTALTDAAPTNYLTVPTKTISVATGDKIYYRIDANGNTTSASSVLATNIYVDPNQDLKQNTILQAHLGNNLTATSFVSGNANIVNDTLRTGNWNFYVAGNTSVAAVTGASGSGEWTVGNLLSYFSASAPTLTDTVTTTGATWMPVPGTAVDSSETLYTVKSNEVALIPGSNSTYAVWTATKSTNLKIDVSFADYNSRSAGVGFQMFKIKANNTFDSVLFPRTVTTTALTNANPTNYLSVPTINTSVNAGDKIYYRVDANGNVTAASSILATTIFTDAVSVASNPVENKLLQANLGNNLALTSFVAGNANVVLDTLRTGNWNFYVGNTTSTSSISAASAVDEWTGGSPLSYSIVSPFKIWYPLNTSAGTTSPVGEFSTGTYIYNGTLSGATISTDAGKRVAGGYLQVTPNNHLQFPAFTTGASGMSFCLWFRSNGTGGNGRIFDFGNGTYAYNISLLVAPGSTLYVLLYGNGVGGYSNVDVTGYSINDNVWRHLVWTISPTGEYKIYINGSLLTTLATGFYPPSVLRSKCYLSWTAFSGNGYGMTGGIENFRYYATVLSQSDVNNIYAGGIGPTGTGTIKDIATGVTWMPAPGTLVDATETSYTVKSNEVALIPGTNSTYAVWTCPKSTNIRVDVSFADYHTRAANGVGFQMFKINSDNTFGSVIFPRTVTGNAITDATLLNGTASYLSVPSTNLSVSTGDKVVYRIDGNGAPTSASSVLATNIYSYTGRWY